MHELTAYAQAFEQEAVKGVAVGVRRIRVPGHQATIARGTARCPGGAEEPAGHSERRSQANLSRARVGTIERCRHYSHETRAALRPASRVHRPRCP